MENEQEEEGKKAVVNVIMGATVIVHAPVYTDPLVFETWTSAHRPIHQMFWCA